MKQTIEWHEQCLRNKEKTLDSYINNLGGLVRRIENLQSDITFSKNQIAEAKRQGRGAFDADRFMNGNLRRRVGER